MSIEEILQMEDLTLALIKLDEKVNTLSNYGEDLSKLTEPQKVLLFIESLEREINNGGFNQFYWNSSGGYAHETLAGLLTIKANKTAELLDKANSEWPGQSVPKDRTERHHVHATIEEQAANVWEACDSMFYDYPGELTSLLLDYVKQNKTDF